MHIPSESPAHDFHEAAALQGLCQNSACGRSTYVWDAHHVVEKKYLKKHGLPLFDPRNALRLCESCHSRHTTASQRIPMESLRDENIDYAFEILGAYAYDYLHRYYDGTDGRVQASLDILAEETLAA